MKIFINILLVITVLLAFFNLTQIDFNQPLEGKSKIAIISVLASICAALILWIYKISKKIQQKEN